jgi:predicted ATPase
VVGNVRVLLEREAEFDAIGAVVGAAVAGSGKVLAIEGEAGVGKTSLLAEGRRLAAMAGAEILSARSGDLEREFPFAVVRQLLGPQLRQASADERASIFDGAAPARSTRPCKSGR